MSQVSRQYTVCDECGGAIPPTADYIRGVGGQMRYQGALRDLFVAMDFCCSQHLVDFLNTQPTILLPTPLYPVPPNIATYVGNPDVIVADGPVTVRDAVQLVRS